MTNPDRTRPPGLLDIPPELRNAIYYEAALSVQGVAVGFEDPDSPPKGIVKHPLLALCRQTRNEAGPILRSIGSALASTYHVKMTIRPRQALDVRRRDRKAI